jgi:hypothetical protein
MNIGMFVGWAVLSPLSKHSGWAPGNVGSNTDGARGWIVSIPSVHALTSGCNLVLMISYG